MIRIIQIIFVVFLFSSVLQADSYLDNITIHNADNLTITEDTLELIGHVRLQVSNINTKIKTINVNCHKVTVIQDSQGKVRLIEFWGKEAPARIYNQEINIQARNIMLETNPKTEDIEILHARQNTITKINKAEEKLNLEITANKQYIYFIEEYLIAKGKTHSFIDNTTKQETINLYAEQQKINYSPTAHKVLYATDNLNGNFNEYKFIGEEITVLRNNTSNTIEKAIIKNNATIITEDNKISADILTLQEKGQSKLLHAKQTSPSQDKLATVTTKDYKAQAQQIILVQREKEEQAFLLDDVTINDLNNKQLIQSDYVELNPKTQLFKAKSLNKSVSGYLIK